MFHSSLVPAIVLVLSLACAERQAKTFTLATTTSLDNSGLLQHLSAIFQGETGIELRAHVVGSGRAIKMATDGQVELTLTHDPQRELEFARSGNVESMRPFARNDFIIVGPPSNPAGVTAADDAAGAFAKIHRAGAPFASRADESGTHTRELELWKKSEINPKINAQYLPLGQGMSTLLRSADQLHAYALTDRATFLQLRGQIRLVELGRGGEDLKNIYSVTVVRGGDPAKKIYAEEFARWLLSDRGRQAISSYRINGQQVFSVIP